MDRRAVDERRPARGRSASFAVLTSGSLRGRCFPNAAGLRNAVFCPFQPLVEAGEFLLRGCPGSHCTSKLRVAHVELRFNLLQVPCCSLELLVFRPHIVPVRDYLVSLTCERAHLARQLASGHRRISEAAPADHPCKSEGEID